MADNQGWVKLYRQLLDKPIWLNSRAEHQVVLITLLLMANHVPNEWEWHGRKYVVQAGQMITSLAQIAQKSGKNITTQNVRTALLRFEKLGFLTNESTKQSRLITIVNWGLFQSSDGQANKATNNQLTNDQQRTNKGLTTNKNDKNKENDKNEENSSSSSLSKYQNSEDQDNRKQEEKEKLPDQPNNDSSETDQAQQSLTTFWNQNGFGTLTDKHQRNIESYVNQFESKGASKEAAYRLIEFALGEAVDANATRWNYVESTLKDYLSKNITTVAQAQANKNQWQAQQTDKRKATNSAQISAEERLKQVGKESSGLPF